MEVALEIPQATIVDIVFLIESVCVCVCVLQVYCWDSFLFLELCFTYGKWSW